MRADWNDRAGEDANYYVAFGRREQDDDEFFATAADVVRGLESSCRACRAAARRSKSVADRAVSCAP